MSRQVVWCSWLVMSLTPLAAGGEPEAIVSRPADAQSAAEAARPAGDLGDAPRKSVDGRRKPQNPRVLFITARDCERCRRELARLREPRGEFAALRGRGWKIGAGPENHLQIVEREAIPEIVSRLAVQEFPAVVCVQDDEIVRSFKAGCTTPLDRWTFGFLLKGQDERPEGAVPEEARVETTGSYALRGNHWSVDGDWEPARDTVIAHLRGPNHAHQLAPNWYIDNWSYEELRSLHDNLHEQELAAGGGGVAGGGTFEAAAPRRTEFGATGKMLGR